MIADLALHRPALYNPALWSRDEIRAYYVARRPLLERFVDDLRREKVGTRPQNRLILGLRGMGKSTLLRRIAIAVEDDPELNAEWLPLTFPEEQYNVATLADFWLNCLDALGDLLESRGEIDAVARIDTVVEALDRKNAEEVLNALLKVTTGMKRRLLLLVDNIDLILERLKKDDWVFREALQLHSDILLIGASARAMEATYDYKAAFYDFFKVDELRGLSEVEMRETLVNLALLRGAEEAIRPALEQPGRLKVLHTLTGGNPRTAVLLYGVLLKGVDGDVRTDLEALLDEVTPLYKARFEELPTLAQQLMDKLALHWDPMSARQLADALGWEVNSVSAQLARLSDTGVVEKVAGVGKRAAFQVAERFFNIWYLMRASRRVRRKLIWLVEFLRAFYSAEELRQAAKVQLKSNSTDAAGDGSRDAEFALALSRALAGDPLARALETSAISNLLDNPLKHRLEELFDLAGEDRDLASKAERIKTIKSLERKLPVALRKAGVKFSIPRFVEEILGVGLLSGTSSSLLTFLDQYSGKDFSRLRVSVIELSNLYTSFFGETTAKQLKLAIRLGEMESYDDGLGAAAAAERLSCPVLALIPRLANVSVIDLRSPDFEGLVRQAVALAPDGYFFWAMLGDCLAVTKPQEAEVAYREAIHLGGTKYSAAWTRLAELLEDDATRVNEALSAFRQATVVDSSDPENWSLLGNFLLRTNPRDNETELVLRRVCQLAPDKARNWRGLAMALLGKKDQFEECQAAISQALAIKVDVKSLIVAVLVFLQSRSLDQALEYIRRIFREYGEDEATIEFVPSLASLFAQTKYLPQLLAEIDSLGLAERWRPLREALAAAVAGDPDRLKGVAPEVRLPAEELYASLTNALAERS